MNYLRVVEREGKGVTSGGVGGRAAGVSHSTRLKLIHSISFEKKKMLEGF